MSGALIYDEGKPDLSLIPPSALRAVARVLMFGAKKYDRNNWRDGFKWSKLYSCSMRHILDHMDGIREDPETGESPIAHAICRLMFLLVHEQEGLGEDDLNGTPDEPPADQPDSITDDSSLTRDKTWLAGLIKFEGGADGRCDILAKHLADRDDYSLVASVDERCGTLQAWDEVNKIKRRIEWLFNIEHRRYEQSDRLETLTRWVLEQAIDHGATRSHGRITI